MRRKREIKERAICPLCNKRMSYLDEQTARRCKRVGCIICNDKSELQKRMAAISEPSRQQMPDVTYSVSLPCQSKLPTMDEQERRMQ